MEECRRQTMALSLIDDADSDIDAHIGALMAVIVDHLNHNPELSTADLLTYTDCFSLLLEADGVSPEVVGRIYPEVAASIIKMYPGRVKSKTPSL